VGGALPALGLLPYGQGVMAGIFWVLWSRQICKLSLQTSGLRAESGFYEGFDFAGEANRRGAGAGGCSLPGRVLPGAVLMPDPP